MKYLILLILLTAGLFSLFAQDNSVEITKLSATSFLTEPYDYYAYHPVKMFDNDPKTSWMENRKKEGLGEGVNIQFSESVEIDEIKIMAGCFLKGYFKQNYRVRYLKIEIPGEKINAMLKDEMVEQSIPLPRTLNTNSVSLFIFDVFKTEKYEDTAISELSFYNKGKQIKVDISGIESIIKKQPKMWQDIELTPKQHNGKWGFIEPTGSFSVAPSFDKVYPYEKGKAAVQGTIEYGRAYSSGDEWEFIDKRGIGVHMPPVFYLDENNTVVNGNKAIYKLRLIDEKKLMGFGSNEPSLTEADLYGGKIPFPSGAVIYSAPFEGPGTSYDFHSDGTCTHPIGVGSGKYYGTWKYYKGLIYVTFTKETGMRGVGEPTGSGMYETYYDKYENYEESMYLHMVFDWDLYYTVCGTREVWVGGSSVYGAKVR